MEVPLSWVSSSSGWWVVQEGPDNGGSFRGAQL